MPRLSGMTNLNTRYASLDLNRVEKIGESDIHESYALDNTAVFEQVTILSKRVTHTLLTAPAAIIVKLPSLLLRFLHILIPSFFLSNGKGDRKQERLYPTAYLDGMRGIAAFSVFICHLSYQNFWIIYGYGAGLQGENDYLIQLPIIKLLYSGPPMVAMFFIISGYALSLKPIKQMRARQWDGLMHTLSSSVFRRPLRLFLPCIVSTFIVFVLVRMYAYDYTFPLSEDKRYMRGSHEDHVMRLPTFEEQWYDWTYKIFNFVHPWSFWHYAGSLDYDRHLWTIPTEFRASMVLFLSLMMTARMTSTLRICTFVALQYWALQWDRWEMILFWAGPVLAELDLIRLAKSSARAAPPSPHYVGGILESGNSDPRGKPKSSLWSGFVLINFLVGLFLASYPDLAGEVTPGYMYLTTWIPEYYSEKIRFWQSIGSIQIIWAVNHHDSLKALFNGSVIQYLGKISYSLYLMHGPVIHTFGYTVMPLAMDYFGLETRWSYEKGFFVYAVTTTIMTIWAADIFWRVFDIPIVKFARWLETKCIVAI